MKLIVGGDLHIGSGVQATVSPEAERLFRSADFRLANLECPVSGAGESERLAKTGPHLKGDESTLSFLKRLQIDAVTLANNHVMDYGRRGLEDTLRKCAEAGVKTVGAGRDVKEAKRPLTVAAAGVRLAILNAAEHEWSCAEEDRAGANPYDLADLARQIRAAKAEHDFVVVVLHGGREYYPLPRPGMVHEWRYLAECGADAIVTHHAHVASACETWAGVPIFYGLGNLVFTRASNMAGRDRGLIVELELTKGVPVRWRLLPVEYDRESCRLDLPEEEARAAVLRETDRLNGILADDARLRGCWEEYVERVAPFVLAPHRLSGFLPGRWAGGAVRRLMKRLHLPMWLGPERRRRYLFNSLQCESHRDVVLTYLKMRSRG